MHAALRRKKSMLAGTEEGKERKQKPLERQHCALQATWCMDAQQGSRRPRMVSAIQLRKFLEEFGITPAKALYNMSRAVMQPALCLELSCSLLSCYAAGTITHTNAHACEYPGAMAH